jgi:uncharacterized protein
MLSSSFSHIKGVSTKTEEKLWNEGIHNWELFLSSDIPSLTKQKKKKIEDAILQSKKALESGLLDYFSTNLRSADHWRMFPDFRDSVVYLDIETTGLDVGYSDLTTCVLYDGHETKYYVNGQNLDDLIPDLQKYDLIVTYNGKCFDIPFLEGTFDVKLPQAHIDLRYVLAQLGYKGGLKGCEKQLGISRDDLDGIDGYFAVLLWEEYKKGKASALDTLLAYNCEDVLNLEILMHYAYNLKIKNTIFEATHTLTNPEKKQSIYKPDLTLVNQLMQTQTYQYGW